ncbi:DUF6515 family protein [Niabella drilacis]|uniref:Uncharacterized protein n=1 Tax=Niabella drilacis (strain DSM 25811 / CCM 8410 / CCUG 62505 / LMG 26954 / E90) TaxID=1285928 RepID=A0A1G7AWG7_NIADE|nr:DUF6515 family protein [Niabella drilacis]SDE18345.1 hypothetical protein SAMN04487894_12522 [Niabella drilacis]
MSKNFIKLGMFLLGASLFLALDSSAQYRRYPHRVYSYHRAPRVSIGIGGVVGWPAPYYRYGYGPNIGVSVGIALPPIGATIYTLPPGARRVYYGGVPYYYRNDLYFVQREKGGYEVVAPPLGSTSPRLPRGARMRKIDGNTYYEYNGTYYRPDVDEDGERVYVVVGRNGTLDTEEAGAQPYSDDRGYMDDNRGDEQNSSEPAEQNPHNTDTSDAVYDTRPQAGDQFDQLPRNSTRVTVDGKSRFRSPAGTYYKEVTVDGKTVYEVVQSK